MNKQTEKKCNCICGKNSIESYSYTRNEPKNQNELILNPRGTVEAYEYANYKPVNNISYQEEAEDNQIFPGVM